MLLEKEALVFELKRKQDLQRKIAGVNSIVSSKTDTFRSAIGDIKKHLKGFDESPTRRFAREALAP